MSPKSRLKGGCGQDCPPHRAAKPQPYDRRRDFNAEARNSEGCSTKLDLFWSRDHIWSLAGPPLPLKPDAPLIGERIGSTKDDVGVIRAVRKTCRSPERTKEIPMFLTLFVVLLVMWLLGFFAFHVASGLIHILLIIAVISLLFHLFRGRSMA